MTVKNDSVSLSGLSVSCRSGCSVKTAGSRAVNAPLFCPLPLMTSYEWLSCVFARAERSQLFSGLWDECGGWRASHNRVCLHWEAPLCVYVCVVTNTGTEQDGKCEAQKRMLYECVGVCQCVSTYVMLCTHFFFFWCVNLPAVKWKTVLKGYIMQVPAWVTQRPPYLDWLETCYNNWLSGSQEAHLQEFNLHHFLWGATLPVCDVFF